MPEEKDYYQELADKWFQGTITDTERLALEQWYQQQDLTVHIPPSQAVSEAAHAARMLTNIRNRTKVRSLNYWWAAAASVAVLIGVAAFYKYKTTAITAKITDVAPGMNGGMLTLADGSQISLDSLREGTVTTQQGVQVIFKNGQISYQGSGNSVAYNNITTPAGRQFHIVLADGTGVWLNAGSSITFPTAFNGPDRTVKVAGEAYFEVQASAKQPFYVQVNDGYNIQVLGTRFNVHAYKDENYIQTTLLTGAIKVKSQLLKPGQELTESKGQEQLLSDIDTTQAVAWKNGQFSFKGGTRIDEVMRQLARWYNIEIVYEDGVPDVVFAGDMQRDLSLMQVIRGMDDMGVSFTLNGHQLLIRKQTK
ncbi:FecR family protein [Chitinophaga sancti]|uniref:FecR family protein n=1 Tax=Chitinophaga sancti TaxID=1004 RepID=UPI003F7AF5BB